jgi:hypothetical protein
VPKTREEILAVLARLKPELVRRFRLRRLALFGSWARGDQRPTSDVDLLVDVDPSIGLEFVTLADDLEAALQVRVDLVSSRAVKPRAWPHLEAELIDV